MAKNKGNGNTATTQSEPVKGDTTTVLLDPRKIKLPEEGSHMWGRYSLVPDERVGDMAVSLHNEGQLQPVRVRELATPEDGYTHEGTFGFTRIRAGLMILRGFSYKDSQGKERHIHNPDFLIRAEVVPDEEKDAYVAAITENASRNELSAIDIAQQCQVLKDTYDMKGPSIGAIYGRDKTWASRMLALNRLPTVCKDAVQLHHYTQGEQGLSVYAANEMLKSDHDLSEDEMVALLEAKPNGLTQADILEYVRKKSEAPTGAGEAQTDAGEPETTTDTTTITQEDGSKVTTTTTNRSVKLVKGFLAEFIRDKDEIDEESGTSQTVSALFRFVNAFASGKDEGKARSGIKKLAAELFAWEQSKSKK